MRRVLLVLWLASVCTKQDSILKCFHCDHANTSEACKPTVCLGQAYLCFSQQIMINLGEGYYTEITSGCTQKCFIRTPSKWDQFPAKQIVLAKNLCCSTSLCNRGHRSRAAWALHWGLPLSLGLCLHHA